MNSLPMLKQEAKRLSLDLILIYPLQFDLQCTHRRLQDVQICFVALIEYLQSIA
jgi:hypothetical protein